MAPASIKSVFNCIYTDVKTVLIPEMIMRNPTSKRTRLAFTIFSAILCLFIEAQTAFGQQIGGFERLNELRRLRYQLQLADPLHNSDVVVILSERAISEAAQRLVGIEFLLSKGGTLKLTSVESELKTAAATLKIRIQAKSSVTMNLLLTARINSGEFDRGAMRLPLRVTDVKLMNGGFSSLILRTLFGEWLDPKTWDKKMPDIEIPMEIAETMRIPAGRFDVAGELPMEISTPEYQAPMKFTVTSMLMLDRRIVVALRLDQGPAPAAISTSFMGANDNDPL